MQTINLFGEFTTRYRPIIEAQMEAYIRFGTTDNRIVLENAMHHSVSAGGKRLRPLLVLATHQLYADDISPILPLACAVEFLHTYSLIHDDLPSMDNDSLRRGKPTCHIQFGEDIAILAGDTLNTFSFELIATQLTPHFTSQNILAAIGHFAVACGIHGMSGGQVLDLTGTTLGADAGYLFKTHALKTGALISASITLPAILNGIDQKQFETLKIFGDQIGQLFQMGDDILDVTGNSSSLGKTANKDEVQNKLTYVRVFGLEKSIFMLKELALQAHKTLNQLETDRSEIFHAIVDYIETRTT